MPEAEQRRWRLLTHFQVQARCQRGRLQNQIEALLEEGQIKLSRVVSDLLGISARRILRVLAEGETEVQKLAALEGQLHPVHRRLLGMHLESPESVPGPGRSPRPRNWSPGWGCARGPSKVRGCR